MKIVLFFIILTQITQYASAYYFYRRADATPPPPPPEVQALIELLHSLEVNYKLSDTALNVTEDDDEKKVLEDIKEKNKKIAEAMFKDQEIDDIIEEVVTLFAEFEESWAAWEESHASKKKKRRLMQATRRNDEKVEEINALKEKVENMNSEMEEAGGGGDSKKRRRSNRRRALIFNNTRRSGSRRNGKKSRRHSRRSFRNYAKNLHGYTNKAFSSLRKSLRGVGSLMNMLSPIGKLLGGSSGIFRRLAGLGSNGSGGAGGLGSWLGSGGNGGQGSSVGNQGWGGSGGKGGSGGNGGFLNQIMGVAKSAFGQPGGSTTKGNMKNYGITGFGG